MGLSIDGMSSYNDIMANATTSKTDGLADKLQSVDYSKATDDELMEVCKDFESYFVEQMFKAMEKMVPKSEDDENSSTSTVEYFSDMLTQEYAANATKQGSFGIAEKLYEQMKRNYTIPTAKE